MHGTEGLVIMLQAGFEPATEFLEGKRDLLGLMEMNLRAGGVVFDASAADEIVCCFHHDHEIVDNPDELWTACSVGLGKESEIGWLSGFSGWNVSSSLLH
jgi:hypothetical protein